MYFITVDKISPSWSHVQLGMDTLASANLKSFLTCFTLQHSMKPAHDLSYSDEKQCLDMQALHARLKSKRYNSWDRNKLESL